MWKLQFYVLLSPDKAQGLILLFGRLCTAGLRSAFKVRRSDAWSHEFVCLRECVYIRVSATSLIQLWKVRLVLRIGSFEQLILKILSSKRFSVLSRHHDSSLKRSTNGYFCLAYCYFSKLRVVNNCLSLCIFCIVVSQL